MEWTASKSGWLLERQGATAASLLAGALTGRAARRTLPRWVAVYVAPGAALGIYEQRSDASPPYAPLRHVDLGGPGAGLDEDCAPKAGVLAFIKRTASSAHVGLRRTDSVASVASVAPGSPSSDDCKIVVRGSDGKKVTLIAPSRAERDDWAGHIRAAIAASRRAAPTSPVEVPTQNIGAEEKDAPSAPPPADDDALYCGGVAVVDSAAAARLSAGGADRDELDDAAAMFGENPLLARPGNAPQCESPNEAGASRRGPDAEGALLRTEEAELAEAARQWHAAAADMRRARSAGDVLRTSAAASRAHGRFLDVASARVVRAVESLLGSERPAVPAGSLLELRFVAASGQLDADAEEGANAYVRREMGASSWVRVAAPRAGLAVVQPLRAVVEYRGYRVIAVVADGTPGRPMDAATAEREVGRPLCSALGVSPLSYVSAGGVPQSLPADAEVTRHTDGTFGLCDVHGLLPSMEGIDRPVFFRPELLSRVQLAGGDVQTGLEEALSGLTAALDAGLAVPTDSAAWRALLHSAGVNTYYLGAVAARTRLPHVRAGAVVEMAARAAKGVVRARLRAAVAHLRSVRALRVSSELRAVAVDVLGTLFRVSGDAVHVSAGVADAVCSRFGYVLGGSPTGWLALPAPAERSAVVAAVAHHCGLRLRARAHDGRAYDRRGALLDADDVLGCRVVVCGATYAGGVLPQSDAAMGLASESLWASLGAIGDTGIAAGLAGLAISGSVQRSASGMLQGDVNLSAVTASALGREAQAMAAFGLPVLSMGGSVWADGAARASASAALAADVVRGAYLPAGRLVDASRALDVAAGLCPAWHPAGAHVLVAAAALALRGGDVGLAVQSRYGLRTSGVGEAGTPGLIAGIREALDAHLSRTLGRGHPAGALVQLDLAAVLVGAVPAGDVRASSVSPRSATLAALAAELRREATMSLSRALGRRHSAAVAAAVLHGDALLLCDAGAARVEYAEALRLCDGGVESPSVSPTLGCRVLIGPPDASSLGVHCRRGLARVASALGEAEAALSWARGVLDARPGDAAALLHVADLATAVFLEAALGASPSSDTHVPSVLLRDASWSADAPSLTAHLSTALSSLVQLWGAARSEIDAARLAPRIVALALRLATPRQQPAVRAALRRPASSLLRGPEALRRVLSMDVSAISGASTTSTSANESCVPLERARAVLGACESVETLGAAEAGLRVLLDLVHSV